MTKMQRGVYILISVLSMAIALAFGCRQVHDYKYTRLSKPPIKITDPNDIKNRKDICCGNGRDSGPYKRGDSKAIL